MNSTKAALQLPRRRAVSSMVQAYVITPRLAVYLTCTLAALLATCLLGKDMMWDTLDYHLYAGFSALHYRFGQDYFAAGSQSYFNPYIYVPFYLLATSKMSALTAACILAVVQSGILWLTYELALAVAPPSTRRTRVTMGVCAVLLALFNPILINQFGASFADVITAELVLAGWLLMAYALREPGHAKLASAGLLLGAASALKLTNSVHALAVCVTWLFLPVTWRLRFRYAITCGLAMLCGFLLIATPWAIHLHQQFGNPFFPLLNGMFHSPQFSTARMQDLRFVPSSLSEALWRPFAIAAPVSMVDDEFTSPDLRYAILCVLALLALLRYSWRWGRKGASAAGPAPDGYRPRVLVALGCGLLTDWVLWLTASGNGRYFTAMACVAAILGVALLFRLFEGNTKTRNYLILVLLGAQALEACVGATYRTDVAWDGHPWFEVSVPKILTEQSDLYFAFGEQSNSFIIPFLAPGSGVINVDGDFVLGSAGANGRHIRWLLRKYSPNLRTLVLQPSAGGSTVRRLPDFLHENDTLEHFGLRVDTNACQRIEVRDAQAPWSMAVTVGPQARVSKLESQITRIRQPTDQFLLSCSILPKTGRDSKLQANESVANLVFGRLERACPLIFQPAGTVTLDFGNAQQGYTWMRRYGNTGISAVITRGIVEFIDPLRGGPPVYLGRESDWKKSPLAVSCWRRDERYYAALH